MLGKIINLPPNQTGLTRNNKTNPAHYYKQTSTYFYILQHIFCHVGAETVGLILD